MPVFCVRLAALFAFAYALLVLGGPLLVAGLGGRSLSLRVSLTQPLTWLLVAFGLVIGWGLWQRFAWAWWLGVAAALVQLVRLGLALASHFNWARLRAPSMLVQVGLLLGLLVLLLPARSRAACKR